MNHEGHPWDEKLYFGPAKPDIEKQLLGQSTDGSVIDRRNMRVTSVDGNTGSSEKIHGEVVFHQKNPVSGNYKCIGNVVVKNKKVEFWVDNFSVEDPIIRIDGVIVAKSNKIPFRKDFELDLDKNESCVGGEVFVTDDNVPPMIFNVQDMLDSIATQKYFGDFNPDLYYVNLVSPVDIPVFQELVSLGGGGGLPVGSYQYSLRYATKEGDRTNRGPFTPLIPVVSSLSSAVFHHPYLKTFGSRANIDFPTSYGIKLKFRVTNTSNYDFIEIIRTANNIEGGPSYTPVTQVVARIDIAPQEISVREFIDPVASNVTEIVTDTEDAGQLAYIERAKSLRYHDTRLSLMNISFASKTLDLNFLDIDGDTAFPVIGAMGKPGHNDPFNHTYKKSYLGGERQGFAIQAYDAAAGKFFSVPVPGFENYQYPNRRVECTGNSLLYSYEGAPTAANIDGNVTEVFEVFDHVDAVAKNDICSFKNILKKGDKSNSDVTSYCSTDPESSGAKVNILNRVKAPYSPYGPVNQIDNNDDHDYVVNVEVDPGSGTVQEYRPQGFGLNYFAHGMALSGVTGFPKSVKSFSIVRTKTAGRVVAQGLGMYSLNPGDYDFIGNKACLTKRTNKIWFSSPDINSGITSGDAVKDIIANPQNYKIQFVSPLGFFSEVYNFEADTSNPRRDRIIDMVSYARVLFDNGQINPTESGVGVNDYVAFNKYRNSHAVNGGAFGGDAEKLFGLNDVRVITDGRGSYIEFELDQDFYNSYGTGGTSDSDFSDQGLKDWTEPFYIVNIVQDGKNVIDRNIDEYLSTGHYQKLESVIGVGNGTSGQIFELVDERWEDCIPALNSSSSFASRDSFVYLRDLSGNEYIWLDVTFRTPAQLFTITQDILNNGFYVASGGEQVVGVYRHSNISNRFFTLLFNEPGFDVPGGYKIIVKYDISMPITFFGGDTTVGENIFAPIDRTASGEDNDDEKEDQFIFNVGFPFRNYIMNPRHYVIADATGVNKIQNNTRASLGYIRQLAVMFNCESRVASHFAFNLSDTPATQFYPATHYVMRPNRFDNSGFSGGSAQVASDNNLFDEYFNDYPNEHIYWKYGGFRFSPSFNLDYSKESPIDHFSKPDVGFEETTDFCTAVAPSLPRAVNVQDAPGLKTFLSQSIFYLEDDQGEIKKAYSAQTSGKGENLYAICEKGVCLILTKKSILSNLNADELSVTGSDLFIQGQYWLSRETGSNDEMKKGMAEGEVVIPGEAGDIRVDCLFIPNSESVFTLIENQVKDIRSNYYLILRPVLKRIDSKIHHLTGVYNRKNDEYWLQVEYESDNDCCITLKDIFVYSPKARGWVGRFDYVFDKYVYHAGDNEVYGARHLTTFLLDVGYLINGQPIEAEVKNVSAPQHRDDKEFIRIGINSGDEKPTRIEFYDHKERFMCAMDQAIQGPYYLKKYGRWEQDIPRTDQIYSSTRNRVQNRLLIYVIKHNLAEDFKIINTNIQHKILK